MIKETMLIKVDTQANNNKFYHVIMHDDRSIEKRWGRVDTQGTSSIDSAGGETVYNRIIREKTRKGYKPTEVISSASNLSSEALNKQELKKAAKVSLLHASSSNPELESLLDMLIAQNRHQIIENSAGRITVNDDGQLKTPLGYVSNRNITEARSLLDRMNAQDKLADPAMLSDYLTLIPQRVPRARGWGQTFFTKETSVPDQMDFLDQLENSLKWMEANASTVHADDKNTEDPVAKYASLFRFQIEVEKDSEEFKRIEKEYKGTSNSLHNSSSYKLKKVYKIYDETKESDFKALAQEKRNVKSLWHGTSASNILSILRKGLFVPPVHGGQYTIAGRMFGDGVYLSDQSTKALNYATGFWHSSDRGSNRAFMFLADVVMGSEFRPHQNGVTGYDSQIPRYARTRKDKNGKEFDSINVRGGTCGVRNNEMIVWNTDQIKLTYLCEFSQ